MLSLTCHSCGLTMTAATEDDLVSLGLEHARAHGHEPPREHVIARIRRHNPRDDG